MTQPIKKALITGINSQDGSYLAELLLDKGYEVHGTVRSQALDNPNLRLWRISHILKKIHLNTMTLEDFESVVSVIRKIKPCECYHLAAQSFVNYEFEDERSIIDVNIIGTSNVLCAIRQENPKCRFYFAGSSEMFGLVQESPQNERTPFRPRSPYGITKMAGFEFTRNYRERYNLFACSGMLFNHESPRRGIEFVTRKITNAVAKIYYGKQRKLELGNLDALRDWGFAGDYVRAMWLMLQQDKPEDYVIGTGKVYSVKEFVEKSFEAVGVCLKWQGKGVKQRGIVVLVSQADTGHIKKGQEVVSVDPEFFRPSEEKPLKADAGKAKKVLKWQPDITFDQLTRAMMDAEVEAVERT